MTINFYPTNATGWFVSSDNDRNIVSDTTALVVDCESYTVLEDVLAEESVD